MSAWIFVAASVACSVVIAHALKVAKQQNLRLTYVLLINYLIAAIVSFAQLPNNLTLAHIELNALLLAAVTGAIFILNFFIYGGAVNSIGIGLSIAAMRMSLALPIGLSVIVFGEHLGQFKILGLILAFGALFLLKPTSENKTTMAKANLKSALLLGGLFVVSGLGDSSLKVFEQLFNHQLDETTFMGLVFSMSFIIALCIVILKKQKVPTLKEVGLGVIVGVPNLYSSVFMIKALQSLDASLAFASVNVLNVLVGTITGILIWKDKVSLKNAIGLTIAIGAIATLAFVS